MSKTKSDKRSGAAARQSAGTATEDPVTTIADLLKAKRHMKARATEGSDDPDEEVFAELCAVLLKHGVTGERAEGILRRMIAGVQPVVAGEVQ